MKGEMRYVPCRIDIPVMIMLQGNLPFQRWEELQQSFYYLNIIFNSHIANIGVFLRKTKNICKKIVKLLIFSKLRTIYICNFTK